MQTVQDILNKHPLKSQFKPNQIAELLTSIVECGQTSTVCADACLAEEMRNDLVRCIRLNQDCADLCEVTARILARQVQPDFALIRSQVQTLALACSACARECTSHASKHEHCRICSEACRRCENACNMFVKSIPGNA